MTPLAQHWNWDGYIKDIAYDPTNQQYYMLYGQQHNNIPDHLIRYDVATDTWTRIATTETTINGITRQYEMWQLTTADFNDFYILATVHLTEGDNDTLVRGTYDLLESGTSHIKILEYNLTDDLWTTTDNEPQIGFYYSAFAPPTDTITRYPMLPDTRNTFTINNTNELIYRGKNGFHAYNLTDGTKRTIKTIPTDSLRSSDCYIGGTPETTFYAWIEQNAGNSILRIDNGNGDVIVNKTYDNSDNPLFKAPPHPSTGNRDSQIITISDMIHHADELYAVLQIKAGNPTDIYNESEGYLINIKVASGNVSPVKHYQRFTRTARSPVLHKGEIYYFEGSHYQYQPHAQKIVRAGTLQITPNDPYPDDTGNLIRLDGDEYIDFGLCWRSAFQNTNDDNGYGRHGGTTSPMISDGKAIHFWAGYGDLTKLNEPPVNDINNWHWLQYGKNISQRIPTFHTNDKQAWERINTLAKLTNATISHRDGKFSFLPRRTRQTTLTADITETTTSLIVQDASRFDNTGTVLINDELITYDFLGSNELSNLTRAAEGSQPAPHKKGDTVLFVDALVFNHPDKKNLAKLNFKPDFLGIYNQLTAKLTPINGTKAEVYTESADSIADNGEKPRDFNFDMLTSQQRPWAETLLNDYLTDMQQTQYEVNLELPWSPHLKLGQTLVVDQQLTAHLRWTPLRILRISHDFDARTTRITARTFTRYTTTTTPIAFDVPTPQNLTFIENEPITPVLLPKAKGGLPPITYTLSTLPDGLTFTETTCQLTGTPTTTGTTIATYIAHDTSIVPQTATTRFRITIVDPLTFPIDPIPDLVFTEDCYIDHPLPIATGGIPPITYHLTGLPSDLSFNPTNRHIHGIVPAGHWCIEYIAKDRTKTIAQTFDIIGDTKPYWTSFYTDDTGSGLLDGTSGELRLYDTEGNRIDSETGTFNIHLGTGNWRGVARTDTRIIFLNNAGNVRYHDNTYQPQTTEDFTLPTGDWQDVALIGGNRLGFLDRETGAVRIYTTNGTSMPSEDIEFGFCATFRSIASDGTYLYVLIENLDTLLAYHLVDREFVDTASVEIIAGALGWQSVRLTADGNITVLHPESASPTPLPP
ncbi:hypothetical protein F4212_15765 [Candidatus Poribacteria bacterium]|nr:hypothetical protein [Candidatus Poribacteria bacterium]